MTALWQHYYDLVPHSNHYKKLEPRVNGRVKFTSKIRRKDVAITRLRLGRPCLNFYLHKIGVRDSPMCEHCNVDETIEHFILHCSHYNILAHITKQTGRADHTLINILTEHARIDSLYDKIKTINRKI